MGISRANFSPELVFIRSGALAAGPPPAYDPTPITLAVSHVVILRLLFNYGEGAPGGAYEWYAEVSNQGDPSGVWFQTTIDNLGTLTTTAGPPAGSFTVFDSAIKRERPIGTKITQDFAIQLNRSTPFIRFNFAEYGIPGTPGTLGVQALMSGL